MIDNLFATFVLLFYFTFLVLTIYKYFTNFYNLSLLVIKTFYIFKISNIELNEIYYYGFNSTYLLNTEKITHVYLSLNKCSSCLKRVIYLGGKIYETYFYSNIS